jgi:putative transposase
MRGSPTWRNATRWTRTQVYAWKKELQDYAARPFDLGVRPDGEEAHEREIEKLDAKLAAGGGPRFFSQEVRKISALDRRSLLDHDHSKLSIRRQPALVGMTLSGLYRRRRGANDNELMMNAAARPGFHRLALPRGLAPDGGNAAGGGYHINRKHAPRPMHKSRVAALGAKPWTTKPAPAHKMYSHRLRGAVIDPPNQPT